MSNYQSAYTGAQIDAGIGKANNAVQYAAQSLSAAQKAQARANTGAMEYPDNGSTGQLLTKTADSATWADAQPTSSHSAIVNSDNMNGVNMPVYKCGAFAYFMFLGYATKVAISSGDVNGTVLYTLPEGVRPSIVQKVLLPVFSATDGTVYQIIISPSGTIALRPNSSTAIGAGVSGFVIFPL